MIAAVVTGDGVVTALLERSWDGIRDLDAAPAWLRSTALNLARSGLRRRQVFGRLRATPNPFDARMSPVRLVGGAGASEGPSAKSREQ
jgi:hypothetical protein